MARWSEGTTLKFVKEYVKHECLWDVRNELYKNRQKRQAAYSKIQEIMAIEGFGQKEIVQKIKNIRSTYSQEKKKIHDSKKSGSADSYIYKPSLKWFHILDGALNLTVERKTYTNIDDNVSQDEITEIVEIVPADVCEVNTVIEEQAISVAGAKRKIDRPNVGRKRRVHKIQNIETELNEINESISKPVGENEFDVFGRNIGLQLQNMPIHLALEAQEHIQTYLSRLRRQYLQSRQQYFRTAPIRSSSACSTDSSYVTLDWNSLTPPGSSTNVHYNSDYSSTDVEKEVLRETIQKVDNSSDI